MEATVTISLQDYTIIKEDLKWFENNREVKRIETRIGGCYSDIHVDYKFIAKDEALEEINKTIVLMQQEHNERLKLEIEANRNLLAKLEAKEIQIMQLINRKWWQKIF